MRAVVDLPAPAGPSIATTRRRTLALTEARRVPLREFLLRVERLRARDEELFRLDVVRIGQTALDRADGLTGLVIVEAHALRAELRIDHIDVFALADRFVGALRLAGAAVDALFRD